MKKILSLLLVGVMVFSMIPAAYATNVYENPDADTVMGTDVAATGELTTVNEDGTVTYDVSYTITVPAKLAPAGSGTVLLEGYWPSDATVSVTADESVEMLNSITNGNAKTLAVTFDGITLAGDNTTKVSDSNPVSVADIENALFGTWSGTFYYNVEYVDGASGNAGESGSTGDDSGSTDTETGDGEEVNLITFTIDGTEYQAEDGTTWGEWVESEYNTDGKYAINENGRVVRTDTNTNPYVATVEYMVYQTEGYEIQATAYKHMS